MQKEDLYTLISNPGTLDIATLDKLEEVINEYPYFQTSRLLLTKNLKVTDNERYNEELGRTAILCADRKRLFYHIFNDDYKGLMANQKKPDCETGDRTEELLESFLSSLSKSKPSQSCIDDAELNIVSTDYLSYLNHLGVNMVTEQAKGQKLQHHDIIDAFIEKAENDAIFIPGEKVPDSIALSSGSENEDEDETGEFLTETLAKIYIKQKKYEQALTIIKRVSLNFPKKSAYFADQIRFLELLIINDNKKNK
ncbi:MULTISPECIES: tetratricopeptide repeat protein [Proteiniphilum]|jgi:hypothetical protein|uniref:tetratricopeptide repeat protein n=1 Tax=Proteiniphilum TaxID=294702 RepID=UPI001EECC01D|nr:MULTISPECIES: tetratricopeptide repeat protein [Proteiniphilum]ULB35598.1 tetratricopeptide repeat protein [Proteiniphilum propionicum]